MRSRYFTPDEANALLPELKENVVRIRAVARELTELALLLDPDEKDETVVDEMRQQGYARVETLQRQIRSWMEEVSQMGAELRDLDEGLVDFPALKQGREVCLCWCLGEDRVSYWHGTRESYGERKPVSDIKSGDWMWYS